MAGDPHWASVVLAMHMDGANGSTVFTDLKGHAMTPAGTAQISTTQSKFGGASGKVGNGSTANKVTSPASTDWVMGNSAFTIAMWVYQTAYNASGQGDIISASGGTFAFNNTTGMHWYVFGNANGIAMQYWNGASGSGISGAASLNAWHHCAFAYDGAGTMRSFVDGVLQQTLANSYASPTTTPSVAIGSYPGKADGATNSFSGYIDDVQITKGVCRYVANFTPPAAAFPGYASYIAGTVKDDTGALCARTVRAYRRSNGALSGSAVSDATTGAFSLTTQSIDAHTVIALDDTAGTAYNALVFDNVTPI